MRRSIRFISLILLASLLGACGTQQPVSPADSTTESNSTVSAEEQPENTAPETVDSNTPSLPAELSFENQTLVICSSVNTHFHGELDIAEITNKSTMLEEAIYNRNRTVEDRLKVNLLEYTDGASNIRSKFTSSVLAGDEDFAIYHGADRAAFAVGLEGHLLDLRSQVPHLDFTKSYWPDVYEDVFLTYGKQFVTYTEASLGTYDFAHCLAFNKTLLTDLGLTSPYELYENNEWTVDRYAEMLYAAVEDVNGDGVMDDNDRYGLTSRSNNLYVGMYTMAGLETIVRDEAGDMVFNMIGNEMFQNIYDRAYGLYYDDKTFYLSPNYAGMNDFFVKEPLFQSNQALFVDAQLFYIEALRDMTADFGIMVYPKYSADQDRFYTWVEGGAKAIGIAKTVGEAAAVGAALELLSYLSTKDVIPVYYEQSLKTQYSRDQESAKQFDLIRDSRFFDLGDALYATVVRDYIAGLFGNHTDLQSGLQERMGRIQQEFDKVLKLKDLIVS